MRELLNWKGQNVTLENIRNSGRLAVRLGACNQFYVTLERIDGVRCSISLNRLAISYDDDQETLKIEVEESPTFLGRGFTS